MVSERSTAVMNYRVLPLTADRLEPVADMAQQIASAEDLQEIFRALFLFAVETTPAEALVPTFLEAAEHFGTTTWREPQGE